MWACERLWEFDRQTASFIEYEKHTMFHWNSKLLIIGWYSSADGKIFAFDFSEKLPKQWGAETKHNMIESGHQQKKPKSLYTDNVHIVKWMEKTMGNRISEYQNFTVSNQKRKKKMRTQVTRDQELASTLYKSCFDDSISFILLDALSIQRSVLISVILIGSDLFSCTGC